MNQVAPTLDTPSVSPTYLRLLCQTLRDLGVDALPLLLEAGLGPWSALLRRETLITPRATNVLIRASLRQSGKPELAVLLGGAVQVSAHGAMGYALAAAATLRQALEVLVRFAPLRNAAIRFRLRESENGAVLELIERVDLEDGHDFIAALIFAAVAVLIETITGRMAQYALVELPFPKPSWHAAIEKVFHGQIRYAQRYLSFHLSHELLSHPCMTADPLAFAQATMECERQMAMQTDACTASLSQRLRELLTGRERDYPSVADTAAYFSMSSRTLMRRLAAEDSSFQKLVDEARSLRARQYLTDTNLTVEEIADRLGVQNTSNFSKIFRRWFGMTPTEFRIKHTAENRR